MPGTATTTPKPPASPRFVGGFPFRRPGLPESADYTVQTWDFPAAGKKLVILYGGVFLGADGRPAGLNPANAELLLDLEAAAALARRHQDYLRTGR